MSKHVIAKLKWQNHSKFLFSLLCKHKLHVSKVKALVYVHSVGASAVWFDLHNYMKLISPASL